MKGKSVTKEQSLIVLWIVLLAVGWLVLYAIGMFFSLQGVLHDDVMPEKYSRWLWLYHLWPYIGLMVKFFYEFLVKPLVVLSWQCIVIIFSSLKEFPGKVHDKLNKIADALLTPRRIYSFALVMTGYLVWIDMRFVRLRWLIMSVDYKEIRWMVAEYASKMCALTVESVFVSVGLIYCVAVLLTRYSELEEMAGKGSAKTLWWRPRS